MHKKASELPGIEHENAAMADAAMAEACSMFMFNTWKLPCLLTHLPEVSLIHPFNKLPRKSQKA